MSVILKGRLVREKLMYSRLEQPLEIASTPRSETCWLSSKLIQRTYGHLKEDENVRVAAKAQGQSQSRSCLEASGSSSR